MKCAYARDFVAGEMRSLKPEFIPKRTFIGFLIHGMTLGPYEIVKLALSTNGLRPRSGLY